MEKGNKPSNLDIFYALTGQGTPDWEIDTLERAEKEDPKALQKIRNLLEKGYILPEAELELENLPEEESRSDDY